MLKGVLAVLVLANVASAIGVVYARHLHRQQFVELSRLEKARDELNIEFGRLQIEQATVAESTRIDNIARTRLGMKFPEADEIVVLQPAAGLAAPVVPLPAAAAGEGGRP